MSPQPSTTIQRPDLGETLMQFDLDASRQGFHGLDLLPLKDVPEQSANFGRIKLEQMLNDGNVDRAPGGGYNSDDFKFDNCSYATQERGFEAPVDARLSRMYRRFFDAEVVAAKRARDKVLRAQEKRICDALCTTSTFNLPDGSGTTSFTAGAAGTAWSTHASATPLDNVLARLVAVRGATGMVPNAVAMDWEAFMHCRECAQIIDRLKYSGYDDPKKVGPNALAELFNVDKVVVFGGQRNGANPNAARSLSSLWTRTIVGVGVVATGDDVLTPAVGRTFHWSEDGSQPGGTVEEYYSDERRSTIIRCRQDTDEKIVYPECWQLITGVLA